jgi:excisionase family DNA binding protein
MMTIYRCIHSGRLPAAKIGGQYRIKRRYVEELLAETNIEEESRST